MNRYIRDYASTQNEVSSKKKKAGQVGLSGGDITVDS